MYFHTIAFNGQSNQSMDFHLHSATSHKRPSPRTANPHLIDWICLGGNGASFHSFFLFDDINLCVKITLVSIDKSMTCSPVRRSTKQKQQQQH